MLKSCRYIFGLLLAAALLAAAVPGRLAAQSVTTLRCFYDDAGRLTKVVDPSSNEADYSYDAAGNLLQITRPGAPAPGVLAIFNFTPHSGSVGNSVTLQGQNFSAVPASNLVAFNGAPATVVSATSTTLVVTVPLGASTGPISLTVGASTVHTSVFTVLPAILIAPVNPAVPLGKTVQFTATETLSNGSTMDVTTSVTWTSSNPAVATISNAAGSAGLATSVAVGATQINATLGSLVGTTTLTVNPAALVSIAVTPANPSFAAGIIVQFFATGTFTDGSIKGLTTAVTWSSTDTSVATVGAGTGTVTTIKPGTTTIAAAQGSVSGSTLLTVTPAGGGTAVPRFAYTTDIAGNFSGSTISAFAVDAVSGQLRPAGTMAAPAAVDAVAGATTVIDPSGQFAYILTRNGLYGFAIDAHHGSLTAIPGSPFATSATTKATAVAVDPTGLFVFVGSTAAGTNNFILAYTIGTGGALTPATGGPSATASPIPAIAVDPSGTFVYFPTFGGISAFALDHNTGALTPVTGSPFTGNCGPFTLTIDGSGRFLYGVAPLGTICAFSINPATGALTTIPGSPFAAGISPAWVAAEPSGRFLYVVNQDSVSGFSIDPTTGALMPLPNSPFSVGRRLVSMSVDPSANFAYVVDPGNNDVSEFAIDSSTGALALLRSYRSRGQPSSITISRGSTPVTFVPKTAYVANQGDNTVSASAINPATGALTPVTNSPFMTGKGPVSVTSDHADKSLYVADSTDGTVSGYSIAPATGAIQPVMGSPFLTAIGPASVVVDASNSFAYVANQLSNSVSAFSISAATGSLTPVVGSPFLTQMGPSALGMDPLGQFLYVPNQASNDVSFFVIGQLGALFSSGAPVLAGTTPVAAVVDPTGKFVYVANASSHNISAYSISSSGVQSSGTLTPIAGSPFAAGTNPVALATDPLGRFLYVADAGSNDVFAYSMDAFSGALTPVANSPFPAGTKPSSVSVDFSGKFLYVANAGSNNVSVFSIDPATGALTAIPGSPFPAGTNPAAIYTTGTTQ